MWSLHILPVYWLGAPRVQTLYLGAPRDVQVSRLNGHCKLSQLLVSDRMRVRVEGNAGRMKWLLDSCYTLAVKGLLHHCMALRW